MSELVPGRYRHYKGGEYTVLGVARHSETEELLVVYRPEYGERDLWVRPLSMFSEDRKSTRLNSSHSSVSRMPSSA